MLAMLVSAIYSLFLAFIAGFGFAVGLYVSCEYGDVLADLIDKVFSRFRGKSDGP